jgi:pimeloyl-ACP methyl ester carboxylesterase
MSRTIVLIHGAWMTPRCWEPFQGFFAALGYDCLAPAWPYHDRSVAELNAHPDPRLARLGLADIVNHYARLIQALPESPILIGHSFGGLITQMLLDRGIGVAGVALDPAPPRGVFAARYPTTTRALLRVIATPGGWAKIFHWSLREFSYAFVHTLPAEEQAHAYHEHVVPESGRIFFEDALSAFSAKSPARVNFANGRRPPLLIIAGEADHIVPAAMVNATFRQYRQDGGAVTQFLSFPGRTHWLIAQPGWEEVAEAIDRWLRARVAPGGAA